MHRSDATRKSLNLESDRHSTVSRKVRDPMGGLEGMIAMPDQVDRKLDASNLAGHCR